MITLQDRCDNSSDAVAVKAFAAEETFDPVIRAVMACDGVGREKTIAMVISAIEAAFPM